MKIIMLMAMTLDGKIAKDDKHFPNWTSREDKQMFQKKTKEAGVVIMGDKTFFTFPAPLKDRLNVVFTLEKEPKKTDGVKWVSGQPQNVLRELEEMGYQEAVLGGGAFINGLFLQNKLVNEMWITIEPKIFGDGISLFRGDFDLNLELLSFEKINADALLLKYKVVY